MLQTFPRHVIFTGTVFVLTVIGFAIYYFVGAPSYGTSLQIPVVIRDSATTSSDYIPNLSARYQYELQIYIPNEPAYDWDKLDSLDHCLDRIKVNASVRTHTDSILPPIFSRSSKSVSYSSHDSVSRMIVAEGESDYDLKSSQSYRCMFSYSSVPQYVWGLKGSLIFTESEEVAFEKGYEWFFRSLFLGIFALIAGVAFAVSYLVYWLRSKRFKAEEM